MLVLSQETVDLLLKTSVELDNETEEVKKLGEMLKASFEENKEALGPHTEQINSILEDLERTQNDSRKAVIFTAERLSVLSSKYKEIIDKKISSSSNS